MRQAFKTETGYSCSAPLSPLRWDSFDSTTICAAGEKENQVLFEDFEGLLCSFSFEARIFERPKAGGPLRIISSLEGYSRAFFSATMSSDARTGTCQARCGGFDSAGVPPHGMHTP